MNLGPTYVIFAGTRDEFEHACHQRCLRIESTPWIRTVEDVDKLKTMVNPIFMGTYYKNPAYIPIIKAMVNKGICQGGKPISRAIESIDTESGRSERIKSVGDGFSTYEDAAKYETEIDNMNAEQLSRLKK